MRTLALIALLTLSPVLASAAPGDHFKHLTSEAEAAFKEQRYEEAAALYRKLAFGQPDSSKPRKRLKAIRKARLKPLLKQAKKLIKTDPAQAHRLFSEAFAIDARDKAIKAGFKRLGYTLHHGQWLDDAALEKAKSQEQARGETRRREIGLNADFTIIRRDVFRFYTNLDMKYGRPILEQMMNAMLSHYRKYCEVMEPLGTRYPSEGLDVVLFDSEQDYLEHTKTPGSAGVYFPSRGVGYFFSGSSGFNFPTMMHEMTHQLNHKVLGAMGCTPWHEEGISEYFGAGLLKHQGKRIELGVPDRDRMTTFKSMCTHKPARLIPLDQFLGAARAQLTQEYYAQSWAITQFLMEGTPIGRLLMFDMIQTSKAKGPNQRLRPAEVAQVFANYGMTVESFEAAYTAYHNGGRAMRGSMAASMER